MFKRKKEKETFKWRKGHIQNRDKTSYAAIIMYVRNNKKAPAQNNAAYLLNFTAAALILSHSTTGAVLD